MVSKMDTNNNMLHKRRIAILVNEAVQGITRQDTLPNSAFPIEHEAEAMYFKHARDFMGTILAKRAMTVAVEPYVED